MFLFWGFCELRFKWNWCYLHWHWCVSYFFPLLIALSTGLFYCCTKCKLSLLGEGLFLSLTFLRKMFIRLVTSVGQRKESPEESNLRLSDSALWCSTTEPQRLRGERGLLRSSYDTRPNLVVVRLVFYCPIFFCLFLFCFVFFVASVEELYQILTAQSETWFPTLSLSFFSGPYFLSMLSIDECFDEIHQCDSLAKCHNTPGNYSCQCPDGYSSQWKDCIGEAGVKT